MTLEQYDADVLRTKRTVPMDIYYRLTKKGTLTLLEGVMGLSGESGEAEELVKKHVFQGHELDKEHVLKELGDAAYYLSLSAQALGYSLEEVLRMNMQKRKERYPNGFTEEDSIYRKPEDI